MIDIDGDPETLVALFDHAENLAALHGERLERELLLIQERAAAELMAKGASDIESYFASDAIVTRLRSLIENHKRRLAARSAR